MQLLKRHRCHGGYTEFYAHESAATGTSMRFGVYLPPAAANARVPVLYYLAGLTCTEETFLIKGGAQRYAAEHGLMLIAPDTSPRGAGVPGETESWDFGAGAGFYLDATTPAWAKHYRMESYVVDELPALVERQLPAWTGRRGIMGHSMGGHGALTLALRHPGRYRSVSALAPISAPSECPWGEKAFGAYLGPDRAAWRAHDATHLIAGAKERLPLLVDQGLDDEFLAVQLKPERLEAACAAADHPLELRRHPGYDHGYYFIQTVIGDHIAHHARALRD
jgi:S-formylglutathione hydrolase